MICILVDNIYIFCGLLFLWVIESLKSKGVGYVCIYGVFVKVCEIFVNSLCVWLGYYIYIVDIYMIN